MNENGGFQNDEVRHIKRECPLRPSQIENKWHIMKNQNSS